MKPLRRVHVLIAGQVHGVAFRDSTRLKARELGLVGWVRNVRDGRVEALFQGPEDQVATAIAWCREGPPLAKVDAVNTHDETPEDDYALFAVRPNAGESLR